jgi:hypothetical protein
LDSVWLSDLSSPVRLDPRQCPSRPKKRIRLTLSKKLAFLGQHGQHASCAEVLHVPWKAAGVAVTAKNCISGCRTFSHGLGHKELAVLVSANTKLDFAGSAALEAFTQPEPEGTNDAHLFAFSKDDAI